MRSGRKLILASLPYAKEDLSKSWYYVISTSLLLMGSFAISLLVPFWPVKLLFGIVSGLLMVRFFILYHDFNHDAILKNVRFGKLIMEGFGLFILAPITIWKRSHDYHHWNNAKLTNNGIGAFPLLAKNDFHKLTKRERTIYLATRHPATIFLGYITLFIYNLNLKTFIKSPKKHWDSLLALIIHAIGIILVFQYGGWPSLICCWFVPFLVANGLGAYLFYAQHNFPGAIFAHDKDWEYTKAAILSSSYMKMSPVMQWFTGNIGYHHIHHLNHHIPFYRLEEAMNGIVEMQTPIETSLSIKDIYACLRLKAWDPDKKEMIGLKELYAR